MTEPPIRAAIEELERENRMLKLLTNERAKRPRKIRAVDSKTEGVIGEDENDVPRDEEKLVERLVSGWINVYDEPCQPD